MVGKRRCSTLASEDVICKQEVICEKEKKPWNSSFPRRLASNIIEF